MPRERGEKVIATNRRARHDYSIEKTYEAGLVLTGTDSAMWVRQWLPTELYPETYAEVDFMLCEVTG